MRFSPMMPNLSLITPLHMHSTFERREPLPMRSDRLWKIEQGFVRTFTWDEDGELITLGIWGPGDAIGKPLSIVDTYACECLTAVTAVQLPWNLADSGPVILAHSQQMEALLHAIRCKRASVRLLRLLRWFGQRFGHAVDQGWLIDFRLTHQLLAETSGTTRVTVTRLLTQLERQGQIKRMGSHRIILCNG
jgi:CRP-like cAMP-binding protein